MFIKSMNIIIDIFIIRVPVCVPSTRLRLKFAPRKPYQLLGQLNFYQVIASIASRLYLRGLYQFADESMKLQNERSTSRNMAKVASRGDVAERTESTIFVVKNPFWEIHALIFQQLKNCSCN